MADETPPSDAPANSPLPEAGDDPGDPLRPEVDEDNAGASDGGADSADKAAGDGDLDDDLSDNESLLSDVDDAQIEDFDPANINIEERPVAVDDSNVGLLGVHKRKRTGDEAAGTGEKKKKKKLKEKKLRKRRDVDDDFSGGEQLEGKRSNRNQDPARPLKEGSSKARKSQTVEDEENLTPEERRKRALDRAMDAALKNPNLRRKKHGDIDLAELADAEIENMRQRMADAARADNLARENGKPGAHKLKMLPEVVAMLNRNTLQSSLVDPEINLLEAVRFFLEPLNDGSLPAYNIQRELFAALGKLPVAKDSLTASGIGKVVLFYTKSKVPEPNIKRAANKLMTDWTRPLVRRTDNYRKRPLQEATFDPLRAPLRASAAQQAAAAAASQASQEPGARAAAAREKALAMPVRTNRARAEGGLSTYKVVPKNNMSNSSVVGRGPGQRQDEILKRIKARQTRGAFGR